MKSAGTIGEDVIKEVIMKQQDVSAIEAIVEKQRAFFMTEKTRGFDFRMNALRELKKALQTNEQALSKALEADLRKPQFESYMTEIGLALDDIGFAMKHLRHWMKVQKVRTPLAQFPARSFIYPEPYGVTLVMAPWNYPVLLCIEPLCGAIAAGNTVVLKPSAYAPAVSEALGRILGEIFQPEFVSVVQGGRAENAKLLDQRFDYIFFTGSPSVGRLVMEKASANLTPVSLELGGKSPVIVEKSADLKTAATRLAFGKLVNAGQTCVAPDYVLVDKSVKSDFIGFLQDAVRSFFPDGDFSQLPVIVNSKHFCRIMGLIDQSKVIMGGKGDEKSRLIEPTIMDGVGWEDPVMQEEIFGPILPIIPYDNLDEALSIVSHRPKPLALYLFTSDEGIKRKVLQTCSFGGGCINDTIVHLATEYMGFGGVGNSGMGSYHGKKSFDTFTHFKSIMDKPAWLDLKMRYHPYTDGKLKTIKRFLK